MVLGMEDFACLALPPVDVHVSGVGVDGGGGEEPGGYVGPVVRQPHPAHLLLGRRERSCHPRRRCVDLRLGDELLPLGVVAAHHVESCM